MSITNKTTNKNIKKQLFSNMCNFRLQFELIIIGQREQKSIFYIYISIKDTSYNWMMPFKMKIIIYLSSVISFRSIVNGKWFNLSSRKKLQFLLWNFHSTLWSELNKKNTCKHIRDTLHFCRCSLTVQLLRNKLFNTRSTQFDGNFKA